MRFYLGVSVWGNIGYLIKGVAWWGRVKVARFFLCYPYLRWSERTLWRTLNQLRLCAERVGFGLDSGAFVGQVKLNRKKTPPTLMDYAAFLKDYGGLFELATSWDYGDADESLRAFLKLRDMGLRVMPVWRLGDDPKLLRLYCRETPTGWVAIGGFGMLGRHNAKMTPLFAALKELIDAIKVEFPDVKFHALGCGLNTTLLRLWQPDSADSTTPLQSQRYGLLIHIKDGQVRRTWYRNLKPDDLPDGVEMLKFKVDSKLRSVVHAWCALKVAEHINLKGAIDFGTDEQ
jgi:hypothetical protein